MYYTSCSKHLFLNFAGARHVENFIAGILDHSLNLPLAKIRVILGHLVALQGWDHVIMGCFTNLLGNICHALFVTFKEGDEMGTHCVYFPGDCKLLLKDHLKVFMRTN